MKRMKKLTAIILCLISIISVIPFYSAAVTVPEKPDGFAVETVTADAVRLSWLPTSGVIGYRIYTYLDGKWKIVKDTKSTEAVITGLNASRTYTFAIRSAIKVNGKLIFCDGYSYLKVKTKDLITSTLSAKPGLDNVTLTWSRVPGAAGYAVYQYKGTKWELLGTTKKITAKINNLKSSTNYHFGIRPFTNSDKGVLLGEASNIVKVKTLDANKVTVVCAAVNDSAVKLNWTKANNATGYRVYAYLSGSWKAVKDVFGVDNRSCIFRGLISDTNYYFRVRAFRKIGSNVTWFTPSDICNVVTDPGVKDVYIHRVENLRTVFESDSYTFTYDNVTRNFGTVPVTVAKNADSFYLYTKVNEMPFALLNQNDDDIYLILDEIESYIKIPSILSGTFDVKSIMDELLPGEDWSAKASVVNFNSKKVVCEAYLNPAGTKMLKFYFKTGKLIAIDEVGLNGIEARALVKSISSSADPSVFSIPDGYGKLFIASLEELIGINN